MKKKLLIVAGAGASLDFGMPSVNAIDKLFELWSQEILPLNGIPDSSLYTFLKQKLRAYGEQNPRNRTQVILSFENLLFLIQNLYTISNDRLGQFNHYLNPFIDINELPEINRMHRTIERAKSQDLHFLHGWLVDKLAEHIREKCIIMPSERKAELKRLSDLFESLKDQFEIGVINLNYDTVVSATCKDLETGFNQDTGLFEKQRLFQGKWNFLYHLHGSVHFEMKGQKHDMHQILWNSNLESKFEQNSLGRSSDITTEGYGHLNSTIITGLDKANQLLREPFMSYYSELVRVAYEADAILFLGYGFGDRHLNKCFSYNRFDGKNRKIVVIDWADQNQDSLQFRHDHWTFGLFSAIPYNSIEMTAGLNTLPFPAAHFKENNILERSSNQDLPMAVWYNGLLGACDHSRLILQELA